MNGALNPMDLWEMQRAREQAMQMGLEQMIASQQQQNWQQRAQMFGSGLGHSPIGAGMQGFSARMGGQVGQLFSPSSYTSSAPVTIGAIGAGAASTAQAPSSILGRLGSQLGQIGGFLGKLAPGFGLAANVGQSIEQLRQPGMPMEGIPPELRQQLAQQSAQNLMTGYMGGAAGGSLLGPLGMILGALAGAAPHLKAGRAAAGGTLPFLKQAAKGPEAKGLGLGFLAGMPGAPAVAPFAVAAKLFGKKKR